MWSRYGSPTGRAGSGTEEEFERALARYREDCTSIKIMFYFKDTPIPPSHIDINQLSRINDFRTSLRNAGILYWTFTDLGNFEQQLRIHLSRQIQDYHRRSQDEPVVHQTATHPLVDTGPEPDELGFLDYLDIIDSNFGNLIEIAERINDHTKVVGKRINQRSREITAASAQYNYRLERNHARSLINRAAIDLTNYASRISVELPLFDELLRAGTNAAGRAAQITLDIGASNKEQVRTSKETMETLNESIGTAQGAMTDFRASVLRLPRMTSKLNRAKRETADALQKLIDSMEAARSMISETILTLGEE